tara:strand:- start:937 stop:1116 length:180 start_codon:yes stop_codon:yes gene_type:complete
LFEDGWYGADETDLGIIIVWDIFWCGPNWWNGMEAIQTYTEEGLEILFDSGVLIDFKNI